MIPTDTEQNVARLLRRLADEARIDPDAGVDQRARSTRPRFGDGWVPVAAAVLVAAALVGASLAARPNRGRPVIATGQAAVLPGGTTDRLAASGLDGRSGAASVWTGKELLVWGGSTLHGSQNTELGDGAALDPTANRWRPLPPAPIGARSGAGAVWTGTEMVVWGGSAHGASLADGAAFNPQTNRWRTIASQPFGGAISPTVVWTGTEMLVVDSQNVSPNASAYDPNADRWRGLATPPGFVTLPYSQAVWTGTEAVLLLWTKVPSPVLGKPVVPPPTVVGHASGSAVTPTTAPAALPPPPPEPPLSSLAAPLPPGAGPDSNLFLASYSPSSDQWTRLPPVALKDGTVPRLVWDGTELLVFQNTGASAAYDTQRHAWRTLASVPGGTLPGEQAVWTGHLALFWAGGDNGMAYDPRSDAWWSFDAGGLEHRAGAVVAWTGDELVGWGGFNDTERGNGLLPSDGIRYRPPSH